MILNQALQLEYNKKQFAPVHKDDAIGKRRHVLSIQKKRIKRQAPPPSCNF